MSENLDEDSIGAWIDPADLDLAPVAVAQSAIVAVGLPIGSIAERQAAEVLGEFFAWLGAEWASGGAERAAAAALAEQYPAPAPADLDLDVAEVTPEAVAAPSDLKIAKAIRRARREALERVRIGGKGGAGRFFPTTANSGADIGAMVAAYAAQSVLPAILAPRVPSDEGLFGDACRRRGGRKQGIRVECIRVGHYRFFGAEGHATTPDGRAYALQGALYDARLVAGQVVTDAGKLSADDIAPIAAAITADMDSHRAQLLRDLRKWWTSALDAAGAISSPIQAAYVVDERAAQVLDSVWKAGYGYVSSVPGTTEDPAAWRQSVCQALTTVTEEIRCALNSGDFKRLARQRRLDDLAAAVNETRIFAETFGCLEAVTGALAAADSLRLEVESFRTNEEALMLSAFED